MLEKEIEDILNIIYVDINAIIFNEKERIRTTSGKNIDKLVSSIKKFGLFHPILLNNDYKLIAGYRRLLACKALGWKTIPVIIRNDPTELEEISIELQENLRRSDLEPYEIDIATAKWKRIYETLYPETKYLSHVKSGKRDSKGRILNRNQVANSTTWHNNNSIDTPRFTKVASKYCNISERSIRDRVQVGEAILKGKFDKKTIDLYKTGKISHSKMVAIERELRKNKKEKKIDANRIPERNSASKNGEELRNYLNKSFTENKNCIDCKKGTVTSCPDCGKNVIICNKGYLTLKKLDSVKCEHFSYV